MPLDGQAVSATVAPAGANRLALDPRTQRLLEAPIAPMLLRLAWPNIAVMLIMASTGLIETWWVSRLGLDALAGVALVFPGFMMMQMLSAGAMGGGISSAVARALGGGRRDDADALVLHAVIVNIAIGSTFAALVLGFGPALYRALGGEGGSLAAALLYSNIVFAGTPLIWLTNALASVIRGTGNMLMPALAASAGVVLLVPLSPCLIFGLGPFPALGVEGAAIAVVSTTALTSAVQACMGLVLSSLILDPRELAAVHANARYTLVFGRSADLDHDAAMRIGGESPGRQAHSWTASQPCLPRVTAASDRQERADEG